MANLDNNNPPLEAQVQQLVDLLKKVGETKPPTPEKEPPLPKSYSTGFLVSLKEGSKKFWNSEAVSHIRGAMSNVITGVKKHLSDILGPLEEYVDMLKNSIKEIYGFFSSTFKKIFIGDKKSEEASILSRIFKWLKGEELRRKQEEFREGLADKGKSKSMFLLILGSILAAIGVAIGAVTKVLILPFQVLYRALKSAILFSKNIIRMLPGGERFLLALKKVGDAFKNISKAILKLPLIGKIAKLFSPIIIYFKSLEKATGLMGKFVAGITRGFTKLFWPLQIFLSLIDFVKGFTKTQGTLFEKIKAGLTNVVVEFFKLPIIIVGWLVDKFLGLFGIESKSAEVMIKGLKLLVGEAIDYVVLPFKTLVAVVKDVVNFFRGKGYPEGATFMEKLKIFFSELPGKILNFIKENFPFGEYIFKGAAALIKWFSSLITRTWNILDIIGNFLLNIPRLFINFLETVPVIGWAIRGAKELINKIKGEGTGKESITDKIKSFLFNIPGLLLNFLKGVPVIGWMIRGALALIGEIKGEKTGKESITDKIKSFLLNIPGLLLNFLEKVPVIGWMVKGARALIDGVKGEVKKGKSLKEIVGDFINYITSLDWMKDIPGLGFLFKGANWIKENIIGKVGDLPDITKDAISKLGTGISNLAKGAVDAAGGMIGAAGSRLKEGIDKLEARRVSIKGIDAQAANEQFNLPTGKVPEKTSELFKSPTATGKIPETSEEFSSDSLLSLEVQKMQREEERHKEIVALYHKLIEALGISTKGQETGIANITNAISTGGNKQKDREIPTSMSEPFYFLAQEVGQ